MKRLLRLPVIFPPEALSQAGFLRKAAEDEFYGVDGDHRLSNLLGTRTGKFRKYSLAGNINA